MVASTSKGVRVAAGIVCAVFAAFALIHLLWAVGITWGLNSELAGVGNTDSGIALTAVSLAAATAGTATIIVTLGRVGWLKTRLSDRLLHIGALVVARAHPRPRAGEAPRPPVTRAPVAH